MHIDIVLTLTTFCSCLLQHIKGTIPIYTAKSPLTSSEIVTLFLQLKVYTCFRSGSNHFEEEMKSLSFLFNG